MSSTKRVVKQNGGFVWVYREPGLGTTFKIYLPRTSGAELAGELSSERPTIKVLFVSAMPKPRCSANGAIDVTTRFLQPFSLRTLARKIREVLDAEIPALADAVAV